jgi:prepilin-type N-terminal cleavage/methylation domain-containing protein
MSGVVAMKEQGFTLIELVVVVFVMGVVSIFVGQTLIVTDRTFNNIDQTTASQQSLRVIADILDHDIRHAGLMVPGAASVCGVDEDDEPDTLYLSDSDAIDPGDDTAPYAGAVIAGVTNLSVGTATLALDSLMIESNGARLAYDTNGDGTNDSDFQPGAGVIIADTLDPGRGTACGRIRSVNLASDQITVVLVSALDNTGNAAQLVAVPAHEYRVNGTRLFWNGIGLSGGIEDLQVSYIFDLNGNDVVDPGETRGDGAGADYDSDDESADDLRELRVSVVARSRYEDPGFTTGRLQPVENRDPVSTADGFRRRVLTTQLRLRNVGPRVGVI